MWEILLEVKLLINTFKSPFFPLTVKYLKAAAAPHYVKDETTFFYSKTRFVSL